MSVPTVTVVGKYRTAAGPAVGTVTFTPTHAGTDATDQVMLTTSPITVTLGSDGSFSVELVPSDAAGMTPNPISYRVSELFAGASRRYEAVIPTSADVIEMTSLVPIGNPPSSPTVIYVTPAADAAQLQLDLDAEVVIRAAADADEATTRAAADADTLASARKYTDVETARAESAELLLTTALTAETQRAQQVEQTLAVADADPGVPSLRTLGIGTHEAAPGDFANGLLVRLAAVEAILGLLVLDGGGVAGDVVVGTNDGGSPSDAATTVIDGGNTDQLLLVDGGTP